MTTEVQSDLGVQAPQVDPNQGSQATPQVAPVQGLSKEDVAAEVQRLMTPVEEEKVVPTGLFNDTFPEELAGDTALTGLFSLARDIYPDLDFNKVMGKAWESLDPEAVDIAYLAEVIGADKAREYSNFFKGIVGGYAQNHTESLETWATNVKEQFGGEGNWQRVVDTFNTNAETEIIEYVKGLLDSPSEEERNIGVGMIRNFVTPFGVIPKQGRPVSNTNAIPGQGAKGLSAAEFTAKVAELSKSGKPSDAALQELREARMLGAKLGL